jgi:alkylated DNA repair protein (DNA oxidative demethylase)
MQSDLFPESWQSNSNWLAPACCPAMLWKTKADLAGVQAVLQQAPLRQMQTPGGRTMSVAMSNCGSWAGSATAMVIATAGDPQSGLALASHAAGLPNWPALGCQAGFDGFASNACLINCYQPGSKMSLHQDRDERDFSHPIVTLSLGCLPASCWAACNARPLPKIPLFMGMYWYLAARTLVLPRHHAAGRWRTYLAGQPTHQPDLSPSLSREQKKPA